MWVFHVGIFRVFFAARRRVRRQNRTRRIDWCGGLARSAPAEMTMKTVYSKPMVDLAGGRPVHCAPIHVHGLQMWTPVYASAAAALAALLAPPPAPPPSPPTPSPRAPSPPSARSPTPSRPAEPLSDAWQRVVDVMAAGVRQWGLDLRDCPLIFASTKGNIARTICWSRDGTHPPPALADDANQIAAACGLSSEVICISTACASGLAAICEAELLLHSGAYRRVVVASADLASGFVHDGFASLRAIAPDACRPFDSQRSGMSLGTAAAWCMLESQASTEAGAAIIGWGMANDAAHLTAPDKEGRGLEAAIGRALQSATIGADEVDLIFAHGTGTAFSDGMEAGVFARMFPQRPPITACKGLLGHTLGVSGLAELAIAREMVAMQAAPSIFGLRQSDYPGIHLLHEAERRPTRPLRTILKTASGFGGVNAAVILQGMA